MNYEISDAGDRLYDAVWILASALNRTMAMVKSGDINGTGCENTSGSLAPLEQFQYSNEKMGCLIQYNIQITNFSGVSVSILCIRSLMYVYLDFTNRGIFSLTAMELEFKI